MFHKNRVKSKSVRTRRREENCGGSAWEEMTNATGALHGLFDLTGQVRAAAGGGLMV